MSGILLVVLDGLGDRQQAELDGLTPLEAATTPNLDALACAGATGMMWPLGPGRTPTSPLAHFVLFGYEPAQFPGRGLLEALGEGVEPQPGEVVCRANFVTAEERRDTLHVVDRPDPRLGDPVNADVDLNGVLCGVRCTFVHTGAAQGVLHLVAQDGAPLSPHVTDSDPLRADTFVRAVVPWEESEDADAAQRTADALNAWMLECRRRLEGRNLNTALVKWAGARTSVPTFTTHTGLRGATLARGALYRGLASALDLESPGADDTADPASEFAEDLAAGIAMLDDGHDFVHVHTKWPDRAAHRKSPRRKREVAETLDTLFTPHMERLLAGDLVVCVTADHQTPSSGRLYHSGGAVPLLICGGSTARDRLASFSEHTCVDGGLGYIHGRDLMPLLIDCADRSVLLGAERYSAHPCLGTPAAESIAALRPPR